MEFSNPFDNPQGQFAILQNDQAQYSLWPQQCDLPAGWHVVCEPQYPDIETFFRLHSTKRIIKTNHIVHSTPWSNQFSIWPIGVGGIIG